MKKLSFLKCFVETLPVASESLVKTLRATSLLGMMVLAPIGATAQVTVGAGTLPAATLDVVASAPDNATVPEGAIVPRLTKAQINAKQASYGVAQTGAQVYVTDYSAPSITNYSDQIGCIGLALFNGAAWQMDCTAQTYVRINDQPKPFTFYELGTETEVPLTVGASGSSALTYEWRKLTGSNIHVIISVPCTATDGAGFNTASFTPRIAGSLNSTNTLTASKNSFTRYFVRITNATGETVDSNVVEVAVGCGAKNLEGEWISFMCSNLGATQTNTMAQQKALVISTPYNTSTGTFTHTAADRALYGDLFQWGRFADGHENRNAIQVGSGGDQVTDNSVAWNTTTPPTYETWTIPGTSPVSYGVWRQVARTGNGAAYFGKFIKTISANSYNWFAITGAGVQTQTNADQLWRESANQYNDPCRKVQPDGTVPSGNVDAWYPPTASSPTAFNGWRIPSQSEWAMIYRGGSTAGNPAIAMANTWVWWNQGNSADTNGTKGFELRPDGVTTTLFLPASGRRNDSTALLYNAGHNGYYWSSSVSGINAFNLAFNSTTVYPAYVYTRGYGMALRCIKN